ncbi:MAG: CHAT domain-containing protein [Stenomitos rutilans HA7619-LM2]|jgi:hypothetical protein|nr:CHAT domain-containing protein [Stenomitos rutilans HA7619-LM2]
MEPIISNIFAFLIAVIKITAILYAAIFVLVKLQKIIRAIRKKTSRENPNYQIASLSVDDHEALSSLIDTLEIEIDTLEVELEEFSTKVRYDREKIYNQKVEEKFREICRITSNNIKTVVNNTRIPKRYFSDSSLYQNFVKLKAFLEKSVNSKEPIAQVSLDYKFHLPVGEFLSGEWEGEVIDNKEYWKEKILFFPLKEGTSHWLGIEGTYTKELLAAPITSKKFREFLKNKIKQIQHEIKEERIMLDDRQERVEVNTILDRILHNTPADGDTEALRQWLQTPEGQKFAQQTTQPPAASKSNINIGSIKGDVQFGNRTYNGTDAETLKNLVSSLVKESPDSNSAANPTVAVRKILVLAASPEDQVRLNLEKEVKEIDLALRLGSHREQFILDQRWGASRRDLQDILLTIKPDIVHFCGHGASEHGLVLQNDNQKTQLVPNAALAELFEIITYSKPIACLVLNACYSEVQVNAINPFIDYIVGMKKEIGDRAAIEFSRGFYRSLSDGLPYNIAFRFGKNAIALDAIPEDLTPVLKGKAASS